MLPYLKDQTITTKRLADGNGNQKDYGNHLTGIKAHIQQASAEISMDLTGSYGKDWLLFCDIVDIIEGDRVIWNSKEYRVMAVDRVDFAGEAHMEVLIRIFES